MIMNDKNYEIKFTINTLCAMAQDGIDVMNLENMNINIVTVRDLLMYGLRHENKKITKNQVGDLMDDFLQEGSFNDIVEELLGALAKSLGKAEEQEEVKAEDEEGK